MERKIYKIVEDGQAFYFAVQQQEESIVVSIFHEDPTDEAAQADAVVQLRVETDTKVIRVLAHLWNDETDKEELATHLITLVEGERVTRGDRI